MSFADELEDPQVGVAWDKGSDAGTMVIAFGGLAGEMGIPPWEFFRILDDLPVQRVFVRDIEQVWYQAGVPGLGVSIGSVGASLRDIIVDSAAARVVAIGNSAGGYASLLFGSMVQVDEILAVSPQTFIDEERRKRYRDGRWATQIRNAHDAQGNEKILDLLPYLLINPPVRARVYYAAANRLDRIHSQRLWRVPGVRLRPIARRSHSLIKSLRNEGRLKKILLDTIGAR